MRQGGIIFEGEGRLDGEEHEGEGSEERAPLASPPGRARRNTGEEVIS